MVVPLIPIIGVVLDIALTGITLWYDSVTAAAIDDKVSQIDSLIWALQGNMSFGEFLANCWLIIAFFLGVAYLCLLIAFPQKKAVEAGSAVKNRRVRK